MKELVVNPRHIKMTTGDIKDIFIILVDISGYTRFIRYHRISLLHAEKIVAELMESILREVEVPVMAHEILGDAISLYAIDEHTPGQAEKIYSQLQKYFNAFKAREASLISECKLCECEACKQVGKLRLKAILHHGQAAFTRIQNIQKISGEDVIVSHRLLKNSLDSKEYILMTESFASQCRTLDFTQLVNHHEKYEDVGDVDAYVNVMDREDVAPVRLTFLEKLKALWVFEGYIVKRIFMKNNLTFRNMPV